MEIFCSRYRPVAGNVTAATYLGDCLGDQVHLVVNCVVVLLCLGICWFECLGRKRKKIDLDPAPDSPTRRIISRFQGHNSRWMLTLCLGLINLSDIGEVFLSRQHVGQPAAALPSSVSLIVTGVLIFYYNQIESWNAPKYLVVLFVYWLMASVIKMSKLLFLYDAGLGARHLKMEVAWLYLIFYLLFALVEAGALWSQKYIFPNMRKPVQPQCDVSDIAYLHPYVNLLSQSTYFWMRRLLWHGYKHPLEISDFGKMPQDKLAETQFDKFYEVFTVVKEEAEAKNKRLSLWWCFVKVYWAKMSVSGLFRILSDVAGYVGPLAISIIVKYVVKVQAAEELHENDSQMPRHVSVWDFLENGYVMAFIVLLATLLQATYMQAFLHIAIEEAINVRSAITMLVYKKSLRLCTWTTKKGSLDVGSITNLMSADAFNVLMFFIMGHFIWSMPLKVGVLLCLLYLQLGLSAVIGAATVCAMMPIQYMISKAMSRLQKQTMEVTDVRLRKTNELLQGIKLLKLYAWELVFCRQVTDVRDKELRLLRKDAVYWAINKTN